MTQDQSQIEHLVAWIATFTDLQTTETPSTERLAAIATEDVRFKDPFNDVYGYDALARILDHPRRNVEELQFIVTDVARAGEDVYVRWDMTGRVKLIGDWSVTGVSHIRFAADGRVCEHVDYWDAAEYFYGRLPVIGWILAWLRGLARATHKPASLREGHGGRRRRLLRPVLCRSKAMEGRQARPATGRRRDGAAAAPVGDLRVDEG